MSLLFRNARMFKAAMNLYPPYWGTGISVTEVSPDFRRMVVRLKARFYNGNAFGTHFGGSLYSMCDPHYALLLIPLLGPGYVIWDKAARIDFLRPGRGTLTAVFDWNDQQLAEIRAQTADGGKCLPERTLDIVDSDGKAVARLWKQLYVRRKQP